MRKIILASKSPWRKYILKKTGLPFKVVVSNYEEDLGLRMPPKKLALEMARGKAEAIAKKHKDALIIGADTFAIFGGRLLGKPHTKKSAKEMLTILSGRAHHLITGFVILDSKTGRSIEKTVITGVRFRNLDRREIDAYVKTGEPLNVAGAYAIQGRGGMFVDRIAGDYWNIVGLPLAALIVELKKFGITPR